MELNEAKLLALELIKKHLPQSPVSQAIYGDCSAWKFQFDNAKSRFGYCHYGQMLISLSARLTLLNNEDKVRDVILHEIAHALTPKTHHGKIWKLKAKELNCSSDRCYSHEVVVPDRQFVGTCKKCQKKIYRHARRKIACSVCCEQFNNGKYHTDYTFEWTRNLIE